MSEIWQLSAAEMARRIVRRELSSAEVVDAHLARIDAVNPALNAIVRVLADEARAAAALADRRLKAGETVGPLHGVPFTVKENIDMAGLPTTWGVPALAQAVVPMDAPVVASNACEPPALYRSAALTCPTWGYARTPSARCTVSPVIPGTPIGQQAAPAAAKPRRSPAA
jgi:anti-sigma factor RsiW